MNNPETMKSVFLPRISGEEDTVFVALNGKAWQVPRGKKVSLPLALAQILEESEHNAQIARDYARHHLPD